MVAVNQAVPDATAGEMPFWECRQFDEIFSFLDHSTGEEIHFNATRMYEWCCGIVDTLPVDAEPEEFYLVETPLERGFVHHVVQQKGIDPIKLARLLEPGGEPFTEKPLLGVQFPDGTNLLIDGHHRVVYRFMKGKPNFQSFMVKYPYWKKFTVAMHMPRLKEYLAE